MEYNILLVDDEELAIRGIEDGVDWNKLHIQKVFKAHSMETAIRMISNYEIQMVITDIEMPNGSGLDLIKWVKANKPEIVCIFYTGYAKFEYAQEAVRLGAEDYLLKPIPYDQLENIISNVEDKLLKVGEDRKIKEAWENISHEDCVNSVEQAKSFIMEHISEDLTRDYIAANVHLNKDYLARIFKKSEGISIADYILNKRVFVAKELLKKTNLPITIISERVGIVYSSYFTKIFKTCEGMTPVQYREACKKGKM